MSEPLLELSQRYKCPVNFIGDSSHPVLVGFGNHHFASHKRDERGNFLPTFLGLAAGGGRGKKFFFSWFKKCVFKGGRRKEFYLSHKHLRLRESPFHPHCMHLFILGLPPLGRRSCFFPQWGKWRQFSRELRERGRGQKPLPKHVTSVLLSWNDKRFLRGCQNTHWKCSALHGFTRQGIPSSINTKPDFLGKKESFNFGYHSFCFPEELACQFYVV